MIGNWRGGEYVFCEGVTASGSSPWHLRRITGTGLHLGGGIDSDSLCGTVKAPYGWDLDVEVAEHHLKGACRSCVAFRRAQTVRGS
jgi:hypothetical protein